jgi:release factor glutamine methyltransferase
MAETLASLVAEAAGILSAAGFEEPRRQARRLVGSALAISQTELFSHSDRPADASQAGHLRAMLHRLVEHEPLSRILGRREFWGLDFALSSATLDPRPETETIVEAVLRRKPDRSAPLRILDLGTGTGCLLLTLVGEYPGAIGFGIDIAEEAARTAAYNAASLGFAARTQFFVGDWAAAVSGQFDVIVVNPPYIATEDLLYLPTEVALYDPRPALDGGPDGLVPYRAIAAVMPSLLLPNGIFVCEVGVRQAAAVQEILRANGLASDETEKDLGGIARSVIGRPVVNRDRTN